MKILIIIIIIGVAAAGFFFFNRGAESPEPAQEQNGATSQVPAPGNEDVDEMIVVDDGDKMLSEVTVVTYTDDGFSPKDITIARGETVKFVNESSITMWPASANHPTHTIYPETTNRDCLGSSFDACKPIGNGASWEFTFNQVGEWGYHNHRQASEWGTITVE